ncbi:YraN family protein [Kerstersia sp.]|uniref:YraN family protein n=1 Tax=Kerstersia sp. TaxID=1930783 RepID=UPI003F8F497A
MSRSSREDTIFSGAAYAPIWQQIEQAQKRARRNRKRRLARQHAGHGGAVTPPAPYAPAHPPSRPASQHGPARQLGDRAEDLALAHLQAAGLRLLARNLQCRAGEIDLVMRDGQELVFVEVRQRSDCRHGGAAASVDAGKQRRLLATAARFLPQIQRVYFHGREPRCRFDVLAIDGRTIHWLKSAFLS